MGTTIHVNHGKLNGGAVQIGSIPKAVRLRDLRELKVQNAGDRFNFDVTSPIAAIPRTAFDLRNSQVHNYYSSSRSGLPHTGRSLTQLLLASTN